MNDREKILKSLALIKDEPATDLMFGFDKLATQVHKVLMNPSTATPFVIAIHGEWGSGKTSLINIIYEKTKQLIVYNETNWKILKFDAWEYERTDVVVALMQQIASVYSESKSTKFLKSLSNFIADIALKKTVGVSMSDVKDHFEELVKHVSTIQKDLEELTGDNRLIVFVDDLDRCNIDNVLDMLEAIKMFLTAKGVIFIVAVDMDKIERAWELRYNSKLGVSEGRKHIEKIFQVKLSLPPKGSEEMGEFLSSLSPDFLTDDRKNLIIKICDRNPRKIKRLLNLVYFVLLGLPDDDDFEKTVTPVISWCILISSFPQLAKTIKYDPKSLFRISLICCLFKNLPALQSGKGNSKNPISTDAGSTVRLDGELSEINIKNGIEMITNHNDNATFEFLLAFGEYYQLFYPEKNVKEHLSDRMNAIIPYFDKIVESMGFTGA